MDNLMSFGKQAFQAYEQHQNNGQNQGQNQGQQQQHQQQPQNPYEQQDQNQAQNQQYNVTGSSALNSTDNRRPAQVNYQHDEVVNNAAQASGQDPSMFSQAMQFAQGRQHEDVDEQGIQEAHQQAYGGNAGNMSAGGMGSAAALQALKHFTSSGGNPSNGGGGGSMQSQLIASAMAEASQLFDKSGNSGNKQDAVSSAAASMMKLMMQSQMSGSSGSGGLGGMLSMASKFM